MYNEMHFIKKNYIFFIFPRPGDNVAKKVGVCAEPEILHWDLTENDRFAIVASDGVFEFITSQNVVDMIAKFEDPIEGALFCRCVKMFFLCDVYDNLVQRCCMHSLILSFLYLLVSV